MAGAPVLWLLCGAGALAQPLEPVAQIGARSRDVAAGPVTGAARSSASPLPQIGVVTSGVTADQVTRGGRSARAPGQIGVATTEVGVATPPSRPEDGRRVLPTRIEGRDRCDERDCPKAIETRASDFPPAEPQSLSAEQRLLVEQRVGSPPAADSAGAVARAAEGAGATRGVDAASPAGQTLGAVALGAGSTLPPRDDPAAGLSPEQAAIATGVLGGLDAVPR